MKAKFFSVLLVEMHYWFHCVCIVRCPDIEMLFIACFAFLSIEIEFSVVLYPKSHFFLFICSCYMNVLVFWFRF
ncbi:hypothetical protein Scep_006572 [Stephania cephalantha]|uniref:Uncharacterized protein n=1 Tax=Stephania cephalantha TaxID=152367 RepID=A0AAP0K9G0_9MAGN